MDKGIRSVDDELQDVARSAIAIPGIASAALFTVLPGRAQLRLAGAAGIEGEPLDRLSTAVLDPAHPIARTLADGTDTFDVLPMAPGGPRLRSHLAVRLTGAGAPTCVGVLAVAHENPVDDATRRALREAADRAGLAAATTASSISDAGGASGGR